MITQTHQIDVGQMGGAEFGPAQCLTCAADWMAVWPLGAEPLECPECGGNDTVRGDDAVFDA